MLHGGIEVNLLIPVMAAYQIAITEKYEFHKTQESDPY
jgi:hypothetical protein